MADYPEVQITCKGTCQGNPGRGAWGVELLFKSKPERQVTLSQAYQQTTNVRMDMRAYLAALAHLGHDTPHRVTVYSNLELLARENEAKWAEEMWPNHNWRNSKREPIENRDLWIQINALRRLHDMRVVFVKEKRSGGKFWLASNLAHQALSEANDVIDEGYEGGQ
jgi:ribonuclease HI